MFKMACTNVAYKPFYDWRDEIILAKWEMDIGSQIFSLRVKSSVEEKIKQNREGVQNMNPNPNSVDPSLTVLISNFIFC